MWGVYRFIQISTHIFHLFFSKENFGRKGLTVCVTRVWVGWDSAWEQEKPEARKKLENAADSHTSGARFVGRCFMQDFIIFALGNTKINYGRTSKSLISIVKSWQQGSVYGSI